MTPIVLEITSVRKDYRGLRPLRIERLTLLAGEPVAILGLDGPAAEVLVNVLTGATLPDRGEIAVFGRATSAIQDSSEWLALVDRFGIMSERAVLLEGLSVLQNLALPFSLDVEPPSEALRARAGALATEVGLAASLWECRVGELAPSARARVRLGRALALAPSILLLEHPTAAVEAADVVGLGREIREIATRRGAAVLALTADASFGEAVAARVLSLDPATGKLSERFRRRWWSLRR